MIFFWNILKGKSIDIQRHPRQKKMSKLINIVIL